MTLNKYQVVTIPKYNESLMFVFKFVFKYAWYSVVEKCIQYLLLGLCDSLKSFHKDNRLPVKNNISSSGSSGVLLQSYEINNSSPPPWRVLTQNFHVQSPWSLPSPELDILPNPSISEDFFFKKKEARKRKKRKTAYKTTKKIKLF